MKKPYIICRMMTSVDGRIDCAMTEHLPGVQEYYDTLDSLNAPTRVSGRVTAELEMAKPGVFRSEGVTPLGREAFSKAADPAHMANNAAVDFVISDEDMEMLKHMERIMDYGEFGVFPVFSGKPLA